MPQATTPELETGRELLAGYAILLAHANPSVSWITSARTDLASMYDALGQPADAAKYR